MIKKITYIVMLLPIVAMAQSTDQNWVKSKTYKVPTATSIATPTATEAVVQVNYYDGLGRPIQQVAHAQSNSGKDIVTHIEYDAFGRAEKEFLPYVNQSASLNYNSSANSDVLGFYNTPVYENTLNPFSQKQYEASPLSQILKQAAPGEAWKMTSGHEIKFDYLTNTSIDAVKLYAITSNWDAVNGLYDIPTSLTHTNYADSELYKAITKDENWISGNNNTTQEFKNKEGQVVLKRTFNNNVAHDTYYIYDQFGNLTFVIPPAVSGTITLTVLNNMCYQYKYDYRNRLVEKKLPGKQWEYIVYDKLDRVVATGPAYNPYGGGDTSKGWMLTKYDVLNRPVYTAWYNAAVASSANRKALQTTYNSATTYSENKTTSVSTINGIATKYTNAVSPSTFILLTVNYYDSYDYPNAPTVPTSLPDSTLPITTKVKGLATGSWVRVLDVVGSTSNEQSYTIYDTKFRPVRSYTKNYLGGYTQVDSKMDWAGKTEYTITKHKRLNTSIELITKDRFEYSVQDRLVKHIHKVNSLPEQLLTYNTYDELGQLTNKKIGGADVTGSNTLQKVDYTYNIRGWLKGINDITNLAPSTSENDLFAFKLSYNNPETATPLFNGNISETFWRTDSDNIKRKYAYQYDNLNRLLEANYSKPGSSTTLDNYLEKLTYDKNGNISTLIRNGGLDTDGTSPVQEIDNLVYTYDVNNLNLLKKIVDHTTSPQGFKDGNNTNDDFTYDANGNMIVDSNKGITEIVYNHLNLPVKITFGVNGHIEYIYNSVGQKLKKVVVDYAGQGSVVDYLGGFQYKNSVLQFFPTSEGYVNISVGKGGIIKPKYVFNYTDHLGNVRISYTEDVDNPPMVGEPRNLVILDENHYYAFGLKHTNYNTDGFVYQIDGNDNLVLTPVSPILVSSYKYKYNGKELQEELGLNTYAYGWREYDPAIGRFNRLDRFSEKYFDKTPYNYAGNNPVYYREINGDSIHPMSQAHANNLRNNINSKVTSLTSERDLITQSATNKKGVVKYSKEQQGQVNDLNSRITSLGKSLKDISDMEKSSLWFVMEKVSGSSVTLNQTVEDVKSGVIKLPYIEGDIGHQIHEFAIHGGQIARGEIVYSVDSNTNSTFSSLKEGISRYDIEVSAYQAQYSYMGTLQGHQWPVQGSSVEQLNILQKSSNTPNQINSPYTINSYNSIDTNFIINIMEGQFGNKTKY